MRHTRGNQFYPRAQPPDIVIRAPSASTLFQAAATPFRQTAMNRLWGAARTSNILGKPSSFPECVLDRRLEMVPPTRGAPRYSNFF